MASTILFAPQVRAVQPAFVYTYNETFDIGVGDAKIYFNISSYNTAAQIKAVLYTIIDPNKSSTWGQNSMIKPESGFLWGDFPAYDNEAKQYCLNIGFGSLVKALTKNQFYQVQLYFVDSSVDKPGIVTTQWLEDNKDNISVASQATLIRPIAELQSDYPKFDLKDGAPIVNLSALKGEIA